MKIAVTGSIGSGKTAVCEYLREKGYDVFDCDRENAILLLKGNEGYLKVREAFPECFNDDELDKKKLSDIVFNDPEKRKLLEGIMHPLILKRLQERTDEPLFAEVPLLFEAGWDIHFDLSVLTVTDMDLVIERLLERGLELDEINERLKNQMPISEKIKRADKIIYNNGSLSDLYNSVEELLKEIPC